MRARVKYVGGFADLAAFRNAITTNDATFTATTEIADLTDAQKATYRKFVDDNLCNVKTLEAAGMDGANRDNLGNVCIQVPYSDAMPETSVDPSYFRMGIGYTFGGTTVAASWYNSEDFVMTGSDGTAYGIGASHELPKVGATFHASVQNYKVEHAGDDGHEGDGDPDRDGRRVLVLRDIWRLKGPSSARERGPASGRRRQGPERPSRQVPHRTLKDVTQ